MTVMNSFKWAALALSASLLAACGGNNESQPNGAIAYNGGNGSAGIFVNAATESQAISEAQFNCGSTACAVVLQFSGNNSCGSIALSSNGVVGLNVGKTQAEAFMGSVANCQAKGGLNCGVDYLVDCNS